MRLFVPAVFLGISLGACNAPAAPSASAPPPGPPEVGLAGTITDANRQPVAGAFVTTRDSASAMSVTVRTDASGRYRLPVPTVSAVRVHAIGLAETDPVVAPALPARMDLTVERTDDVFAQLPSSSYYGALPDGETKRQFILDCGGCHQFNRVSPEAGPLVHDRDYWVVNTGRMLGFAGAGSGFPIMAPGREEGTTADWLIQHLGTPGGPLPVLTPPPFELATERVLITEYDVPARRDLPHDLMPDGNGTIVVTGMNTGQMYTLDPATGAWGRMPGVPSPRALAIDEEGIWWVLLGTPRQIVRIDPATGDKTSFDIGVYPHSIALAEDGPNGSPQVWFNAHFSKDPETIGVLDPS
ncbi:MAG: carboxypeptidase regulatory-like domain-containing protein, partial [Pseudomonadota bacterium]